MSTLPAPSFGALLRHARRAAGLTQAQLAERASLSVDLISKVEREVTHAPQQYTLDQLANALQLSPEERARWKQVTRGTRLPSGAAATLDLAGPVGGATLPLVGRAQELARLVRHLAGDGPPLLLLAGEPGMGKSRLLLEARLHAQAQGWTILEGGCHRRSGQEPFVPLLGALARALHRFPPAQQRQAMQGCGWLVRLLPELAGRMPTPASSWTLPPEQERRLMFAAFGRALGNIAGPLGTLLVLDDLQWAGADALDLLATLLYAPGESPLRILGAYRTTEVRASDPLSALFAELGAAGLATEQLLGPLAAQESRTLLTSLLEEGAEADNALREQLVVRTGGVPYFLVSCAEGLQSGALAGAVGGVPWNVAQSIRQRVTALPLPAQELLEVAAIAGRSVSRTLLVTVASAQGQRQREVVAALERASQAQLLIEEGSAGYSFAHDLIREVVLADLSAARRALLHQQVGEALSKLPPPLRVQLDGALSSR